MGAEVSDWSLGIDIMMKLVDTTIRWFFCKFTQVIGIRNESFSQVVYWGCPEKQNQQESMSYIISHVSMIYYEEN